MNLPNRLTAARMVLIPVMVALMYPNTPVCNTLATIVFALAQAGLIPARHPRQKRTGEPTP